MRPRSLWTIQKNHSKKSLVLKCQIGRIITNDSKVVFIVAIDLMGTCLDLYAGKAQYNLNYEVL